MVEALLINAFFGLASLTFKCQAAKSIDQALCSDIRADAIRHGIPIDKSQLLGQNGYLEVSINTTRIGLADDDSPISELVVVVTKFVVKRPLVDPGDDDGYVYNAVVYMHSDTSLVSFGKTTQRASKISKEIIEEIADQWNKSHHRDKA